MGVHIRYMGTKRELAPAVARIISELPAGPCLDLFAGMCSVAGAISNSGRNVWCNDLQKYAALVAESLITSIYRPPTPAEAQQLLHKHFNYNLKRLQQRWEKDLRSENKVLSGNSLTAFNDLAENWKHVGNDGYLAKESSSLKRKQRGPHRLVTLNFAHGYFGLKQAIELDSLRYAIDKALERNELTAAQAKWCLVALLQTANRLVTSTGHFAQFLRPHNRDTFQRIKKLRCQSAWDRFLTELSRTSPYGNEAWRSRNRVFCHDAAHLAHDLGAETARPAVVYADPPYSRAQYSRYYHVLETLVLYDYPVATGSGRYRDDRHNTGFSKASSVHHAFCDLIAGVASTGAAFLLSYPSNGLLIERGFDLFEMVRSYYRVVDLAYFASKEHSTFGGSQGEAKKTACEMILVATKPR